MFSTKFEFNLLKNSVNLLSTKKGFNLYTQNSLQSNSILGNDQMSLIKFLDNLNISEASFVTRLIDAVLSSPGHSLYFLKRDNQQAETNCEKEKEKEKGDS